MPPSPSLLPTLAASLLFLVPPGHAVAGNEEATAAIPESSSPIEVPTADVVDQHMPAGETLDGEAIYDRFLKNRRRLTTAIQYGRIESTDDGGRPQTVRLWVHAKDYRDANDDAVDGILAKTLIKLVGPSDIRHTGYLYTDLEDAEDEQFMYSPHRGRTTRVNLRGSTVAGTDFNFDDFLINLDDVEDATYHRHVDQLIDGVPVYVVDAVMKPTARSSYFRSRSYLEQEHYVPLKARYWDDAGVEAKLLTSPHSSIEEFEGVWLARTVLMRNVLENTESTYYLETLEPNAELDDQDFSISTLGFRP